MLKIRDGLKIYLYTEIVDMRKSIQGLSALVISELLLSPDNGSVYIFSNRSMDKVKILFYVRNGFVLYYKVLSKKKFSIIKAQGLKYNILTVEQLDWLLAGLDIEVMQNFPEVKYSYFY